MNYIVYLLFPLFFTNFHVPTVKNPAQVLLKSDQDSVIRLFNLKNSSFRSSVHSKRIKNFTLMQLDTQAFHSMKARSLQRMDFSLPFKNNQLDIELEAMQIFAPDFQVRTSGSNGKAVEYTPGNYYVGKIAGDPKSVVTLSVFENEINGVISSQTLGNLNLGKSSAEDPGEYILYGQDEAIDPISFDCSTTETPLNAPDLNELRPQIDGQLESRAAGCVSIDFELTFDVYTYFKNSVPNSTNWITALFTGVKALYLAEGIDINIKSVYVWTSADGYSSDVSSALTALGNRRINDPAFTGNLVHLVRGKTCSGGCSLAGVAWLNALCKSNIRYAVSEPIFTYAAYPSYSWSVNVLAHEMGHNFGSNHTHWCGWTGGPIDNCLAPEGSCSPGPSPGAGGGTIMSYCHNVSSVGIKFSNGFGPQPGNTIRSRYNAATCLAATCGGVVTPPPPPTPTCSDGVKNGTETGVDCGGSCSPCVVSTCTSPVNLSQGKAASQSTTYGSFSASLLNDGSSNNFNHTNSELQPWWQVDLGSSKSVGMIEITVRKDCCMDRVKRFKVFVSESPVASYTAAGSVYEYNNASGMANGQVVNIPNLTASGRYVRVWVDNTGYGNNPLHFSEVKVFQCSGGTNPCLNNQNPTVTVNSSASSYPRGSSFTVNANASDQGGSISSVDFYNGSTLLGTDNSSPYSITVNPATLNTYTITAKATDNCNASTTSSALTITTTTSCSDGFQNGNETGVDCGGSCTACAQGCASPVVISQGKTATQSTTYNSSFAASKAVDGIKTVSNFTHTNNELQPWLQVDLGGTFQVSSIDLTNRQDCCGNRIKRFKIFVSATPITSYATTGQVYTYDNANGLGQFLTIPNVGKSGRYVRIWVDNTGYGNNPLHISEFAVKGCAASAGDSTNLVTWSPAQATRPEPFKVNIYPNPTHDLVNFDYSSELDADLDATVFDVSGRRVYQSTIVDKKLDLSTLENGSYFIHLNYKGEKLIKKVLKF